MTTSKPSTRHRGGSGYYPLSWEAYTDLVSERHGPGSARIAERWATTDAHDYAEILRRQRIRARARINRRRPR